MKLRLIVVAICGLLGENAFAQVDRIAVDLELVLAVDVSFSMAVDEQRIQRDGYVDAFRDPAVAAAAQSGPLGRIAVTYVEWGGTAMQVVPWTLIDGPSSATRFADALSRRPLQRISFTSLSNGIAFSRRLFRVGPFDGTRRIIDVSGDGPNNSGAPVPIARDAAIADGIVIDGLPISLNRGDSTSIPDLDAYYEACVIGGNGAFLLKVSDIGDLADAISEKLLREIGGVELSAPRLEVLPLQRAAVRETPNCFIGEEMQERRIGQ